MGANPSAHPGPAVRVGVRRPLRRALAVAAVFACLAGAAASSASAAIPPQGVYEECGAALQGEQTCLDRLDQIQRAGFKVVLNYTQWFMNRQQLTAYADHAEALGLKLIYPLNARAWRDGTDLKQYYPWIAPDCDCSDNDGFLRTFIGITRQHPATWGYYVADEAPAAQVAEVDALRDRLHALDPDHPQLLVSLETATSLGANLAPAADSADVIGSDFYPVPNQPLQATAALARNVQKLADDHGRLTAMVLQAFSWAQYPNAIALRAPRWPTRDEMTRMRDLVLANSRPSVVLWYSFFDVLRSDAPAAHLADLIAAATAPAPVPATNIVAAPPATTTARTATFRLSSDYGSSYECRLDSSRWAACDRTTTYEAVRIGAHSFVARARDANGVSDETPAVYKWLVVAPPPPAHSTPGARVHAGRQPRGRGARHGKKRRRKPRSTYNWR